MATYVVTTSNWNDASFWSAISETGSGHEFDFSILPDTYSVSFNPSTGIITISDGATTFTIGEPGIGGTDTNLGGVTALDFFNYVIGSDGEDTITSGSGNDTLDGGAGNDTFRFGDGWGTDSVLGGNVGDEDALDFSSYTTGGVTVTFTGSEDGTASADGNSVTFDNIENIIGSDQGDTLDASADSSGIGLYGAGGNDTLHGGAGNDSLDGGADADTIYGGDGTDDIQGGGGDDVIFGGGPGPTTSIGGSDTVEETWPVIFLGNAADLDPDETDADSENATDLVGNNYGGAGNELYNQIFDASGDDTDGNGLIADNDNDNGNPAETFTVDGVATTLDSIQDYWATATFADGTTETFYAEIGQTVGGDLYLFPTTDLSNPNLLTSAGPIVSLTIDSLISDNAVIADDRVDRDYEQIGPDTDTSGDTIDGGDGNDTIDGGAGDDSLEGGEGDDSLLGGDDLDVLYGGAGNDTIDGGAGFDELYGGEGNDLLIGGSGASIDYFWVESNHGNDTISDIDGTGHIRSTMAPNAIVTYTNDYDGTFVSDGGTISFEGINLIRTGEGDDTIDGSLSTINLSLDGYIGNDTLTGGSGNDTVFGGWGNDSLTGGLGNDTLDGSFGNDIFYSDAGDDIISGGADADVFYVQDGFGNDTITGGETTTDGTDTDRIDLSGLTGPVTVTYTGDEAGTITDGTNTITFSEIEELILPDQADVVDATLDSVGINVHAGGGNDTVTGGFGNDTIDGGHGRDSLVGGDGNDSIHGDLGNDTILGGAGDDTIDWGDNSNYVDGGTGNDFIFGGPNGTSTVLGGDGNDTIQGGNARQNMYGGEGDDLITDTGGTVDILDGGSGNDTLAAGNRNDTLTGGTGDDSLSGEAGNDTFIYNVGDGHDTITDFNTGNTGTLDDGNSGNNDFIDLSSRYDHLFELWADQADDGILNQSNSVDVHGNAVDYSDNDQFGPDDSLTFTGAAANDSFFTEDNTGVVCFGPGTMIETPKGPRAVETLVVGDPVVTMDRGIQEIQWLHSDPHPIDGDEDYPIQIKAGSLGLNKPERDLIVSPQHRILVGEAGQLENLFDIPVLVPAKSLLSIPGIRKMRGKRKITWWHFACANHGIVTANGAKTENLLLGKMVFKGLPKQEKDQLLTKFDTGRAHDGALNGKQARPLLGPGEVRRILKGKSEARTIVEKRKLVRFQPPNEFHIRVGLLQNRHFIWVNEPPPNKGRTQVC